MKVLTLMLGGLSLVLSGCGSFGETGGTAPGPDRTARPVRSQSLGDARVSGPYTHENLSVFLIHGEDRPGARELLTLAEAIEAKKVVVHETAVVEELAVENLSDEEVYIQSGDIVKGGQQDRVLTNDIVLEPRSGRVPIASLCVEQGRWSGRPGEASVFFRGATATLPQKELKLAAKHQGDQSQVWSRIAALRPQLALSDSDSTSLQLALEDDTVEEAARPYITALASCVDDQEDVIGFAFAINGQLNCADVYATRSLFRKLFHRLLDATAIEALTSKSETRSSPDPAVETVRAWLEGALEGGEVSRKSVSKRVVILTRETDDEVFFETQEAGREGAWIHRNLIRK